MMAIGIDQIFRMLSWNNDRQTQEQGIHEAKKIKNLSVLIQPIESKSIWENCANVLASKSDDELEIYFMDLFRWIQDMNWPGAEIIYDRLEEYHYKKLIRPIELAYQLPSVPKIKNGKKHSSVSTAIFYHLKRYDYGIRGNPQVFRIFPDGSVLSK